jgi:hypothetical protein
MNAAEQDFTLDAHRACLYGNATPEQQKAVAYRFVMLQGANSKLIDDLDRMTENWTKQFERNGHIVPAWCKQVKAASNKAKGAAA